MKEQQCKHNLFSEGSAISPTIYKKLLQGDDKPIFKIHLNNNSCRESFPTAFNWKWSFLLQNVVPVLQSHLIFFFLLLSNDKLHESADL